MSANLDGSKAELREVSCSKFQVGLIICDLAVHFAEVVNKCVHENLFDAVLLLTLTPAALALSLLCSIIEEFLADNNFKNHFKSILIRGCRLFYQILYSMVVSGLAVMVHVSSTMKQTSSDLSILFSKDNKDWKWNTLPILRSGIGFCTLAVSIMSYSEQTCQGAMCLKYILAWTSNVASLVFRLGILPILFQLAPWTSTMGCAGICFGNGINYFFAGYKPEKALLSGLSSMFSPFGTSQCHILGNSILQLVHPKERRKVQYQRELKLVKRAHYAFFFSSLVLYVEFIVVTNSLDLQNVLLITNRQNLLIAYGINLLAVAMLSALCILHLSTLKPIAPVGQDEPLKRTKSCHTVMEKEKKDSFRRKKSLTRAVTFHDIST